MPALRGTGFEILGKVDDDHAADAIAIIISAGLIVCLSISPAHWFFKNKNSVESSSFGSFLLQ